MYKFFLKPYPQFLLVNCQDTLQIWSHTVSVTCSVLAYDMQVPKIHCPIKCLVTIEWNSHIFVHTSVIIRYLAIFMRLGWSENKQDGILWVFYLNSSIWNKMSLWHKQFPCLFHAFCLFLPSQHSQICLTQFSLLCYASCNITFRSTIHLMQYNFPKVHKNPYCTHNSAIFV